MKQINIGATDLRGFEIALGCMRMAKLSTADAEDLLKVALDVGIDFFDHADIYGGGRSEEVFSDAVGGIPPYATRSFSSRSAASARACLTSPKSTS